MTATKPHAWELTPSQQARFWSLVRLGPGCWPWQGSVASTGYGQVGARVGPKFFNFLAHRVAWELANGPIPDETLDHLCRVRLCVRPSHLEPVSRGENTLRGETTSGRNLRKTVCKHGHPFTPENTVYRATGGRRCLTCTRAYRSVSQTESPA